MTLKELQQMIKEEFDAYMGEAEDDVEVAVDTDAGDVDADMADDKELADVKKAAKNTVAQAKDVVDAAKGKKRRGKKPYYKNKNKTNNNSKK